MNNEHMHMEQAKIQLSEKEEINCNNITKRYKNDYL